MSKLKQEQTGSLPLSQIADARLTYYLLMTGLPSRWLNGKL